MKHFTTDELCASFLLDGKKIYITPGTHTYDGGLEVTLEHSKDADNADYLKIHLKNTGDANTARIRNVKTLDLEVTTAEVPLYHSLDGDDCGAVSFMPRDFEVTGDYHEEPCGGRSSDLTGFPYFDLAWGTDSAVFAIGWTGQWSKDILKTDDGFRVQIGLVHSDFYLKPGESVSGASVLIVTGTGATAARQNFRRIMREHYSPRTRLGDAMYLPTAIQCFDRYYAGAGNVRTDEGWATEAGQYEMVDCAKKTGYIDTLWIDAAWFKGGFLRGGVGNLGYDAGFPRGLRPVADYAHANDMKFVVWFEPERATPGTDLSHHEDKLLLQQDSGKTGIMMVNLADDNVRAFVRDYLIGMIRDNAIDVYRQDFNFRPLAFWTENDEDGRDGITEMKYIAGLYDLWDSLLAEFPHLLIDNCASGGRRLDLETSRRSVTLWKSDTGCFPENAERQQLTSTWSQNQGLGLYEYLPYLSCAVWEYDAYTVRSTATQGLACNFDVLNPAFDFAGAEKMLAEVNEMKEYWDGDFFPLTKAAADESVWCAFQLSLGERGAAYVFRRSQAEEKTFTLALRAVDENLIYRVRFSDEELHVIEAEHTGAELAAGIDVTIPQKRGSLLVRYEVKA